MKDEGAGRYIRCTQLFETDDFLGVLSFAFTLLAVLLGFYGLEELDLVFFECAKLVCCLFRISGLYLFYRPWRMSTVQEEDRGTEGSAHGVPSLLRSSHSSCLAALLAASFCTGYE